MMKKVLMLLCSVALLTTVGCGPSKPDAVIAPPYNPDSVASKAMELYDKDGDKKLSADELKACPSMLWSLKSIDTDGDGAISDAEIKARIQGWIDMKVALTCPIVKFQLKNGKVAKDVIGKNVVLTPDPMMGELLKTSDPIAIDDNCQCSPSTPGNQDNLGGMSYGFYNIKIDGTNYSNLGVEIYDGAKSSDMDSFVVELPKKGK
ncbi:MAG: EF-hand domain-containing protein [Planctomycetia bacterium]|nr:EF-hand domain-containing protein [Planctomycetia bacterium]